MSYLVHGTLRHLLAMVCAVALLPASTTAGDGPGLEPDPLSYVSPSRNFDTIHTRVDLDLDLEAQTIAGSVTHTLQAIKPGLRTIRLNCVDLDVESVTIDGRPVEFDYPVPGQQATSWIDVVDYKESDDELLIYGREAFKLREPFELVVTYNGSPKEGLYFIAPEKGIPEKRYEVWSQGEGEDNRYWIPCFDYPNDKATFEGIFRVESGIYVLSNGVLVEQSEVGGKQQYHWRLDTPQVSYLMMVAAAEYEIVEDTWRDVKLMYLAPPGTDHDTIMRAYGQTPAMLEFFSNTIGIDYPFKKYAQVTVQNFIYGGMENTTATVMNTRILYDERFELTKTEQGLVAHELAHQWWGDMVTCAEWSHMWLNEGFSTYFQTLYREHKDGDAAFRYNMDENHSKTVAADDKDARPMVVDFFNRVDSRNSTNVYRRGASVLHMLRAILGDDLFFECFRNYGEQFKFDLAETRDFTNVVKRTTGENLDWFFEQWVYLTGYPKLKVRKLWNAESGALKLSVTQTQEVGELTPLFRLPLDIEITAAGTVTTHHVVIDRASQDFYFAAPANPDMVIFDKGDWVLKTLDFAKGTAELIYQLENGDPMAQVRAARDLGKKRGDAKAVAALSDVLNRDGFWGLRHEVALALGELGAAEALLAATSVDDARARLAVAEAMAKLDPSRATDEALLAFARNDRAWQVRARAVTSLVAMKSDAAEKACLEALKTESTLDVVRNAGLEGLATLKSTKNMGKVKRLAEPGNRRTYRHTAITSYAKLARVLDKEREREDAADFLAGMLDDWYLKTRLQAISAINTLGEDNVVADLRATATSDPVQAVRANAARVADALEAREAGIARTDELQTEIRSLSNQIRLLERDMKALQGQLPSSSGDERLSRKEDNDE